jgi:hypothetical protein
MQEVWHRSPPWADCLPRVWGPVAGQDQKGALFALRPAGQCGCHHLPPLRGQTETQYMASSAAPGGHPGWLQFGPGAHSCGFPWTDGGETRFWGAYPGEASASGSTGPQLPDPVSHPDQHAHGHTYRDAPADLHSNGHRNSHTYSDGDGHTYRNRVSHPRDAYSYANASPHGYTHPGLCHASPARTGRWKSVRRRDRKNSLALGIGGCAGRR